MDRWEHHELLSAYLDGEVTPEERAQVDQLLESSPEWRRELDDLARLSDLIRGLPRESAPAELSKKLQQIVQPVPSATLAAAVKKRSLKREILAALTGVAVTAAGMLFVFETADRSHSDSMAIVQNGAFQPEGSDFFADRQVDTLGSMATSGEKLAGNFPASTPVPSPARGSVSEELAKPTDSRLSGLWFAGVAPVKANVNWSTVRIGDLVPYLVQNENGVAVMELTVVDIHHTADQIEILLDRFQTSVLRETEAFPAQKDQKAEMSKPQEMITLYIEAPGKDMADLLREMAERDMVLAAQLQPPVELSSSLIAQETTEDIGARVTDSGDEQLVKQEAVDATNRYLAQRHQTSQYWGFSQDFAQNPLEKETVPAARPAALPALARSMQVAEQNPSEPTLVERNESDEQPANALAATTAETQSYAFTRRRGMVAVQNTVKLAQETDPGVADSPNKDRSLDGVDSKLGDSKNLRQKAASLAGPSDTPMLADEISSPTVRVLFVLQQAAPTASAAEIK